MKKFVSLALALVMVLSLAVVVSAATVTAAPPQNETHDIRATYVEGSTGVAYSVTIAWTDPSFTYTNGAQSWNAEDHVWEDTATSGTWTSKTAGQVVVTNDSSVAVAAAVTIVDGEEYIELGSTTSKTLAAGVEDVAGDALTVAISLKDDAPATTGGVIAQVKVALTAAAQ